MSRTRWVVCTSVRTAAALNVMTVVSRRQPKCRAGRRFLTAATAEPATAIVVWSGAGQSFHSAGGLLLGRFELSAQRR